MSTDPPVVSDFLAERLAFLGEQIRMHRKALGINATAAAEAAGVSRVTWHRIEQGAPSVSMGAYANALGALDLDLAIIDPSSAAPEASGSGRKGWIPARIRLHDYPQLRQLAWQVRGTDALSPREALGIYERNWRHLDLDALQPAERDLIEALRIALGSGGDV